MLFGIFRRRTGPRKGCSGAGFNARFFMRDIAGYPTALIFRFPALIKVVAIFKSKNRRCGNSSGLLFLADSRNKGTFCESYSYYCCEIFLVILPHFFHSRPEGRIKWPMSTTLREERKARVCKTL